jgi:putative ribosome biogenesis GTPase RsgA
MVTATGGGGYSVLLDEGEEVQAVLRGRLKLEARVGDRVVIGDRVLVVPVEAGAGEKGWAVERVEPRASQIVRRGPTDRRPKVIAANVDRMLAVVAARDPEPRLEQLDRLLVIAEANGIRPVILSSLLNALAPELELRTGELSRKVRRGRHTTVRARLIRLPSGGLVADTPGFGDVGVWGVSADEAEGCFPEIAQRREGCRFRGCAHLTEPGCAVLAAVEAGEVPESRWGSYVALREGV